MLSGDAVRSKLELLRQFRHRRVRRCRQALFFFMWQGRGTRDRWEAAEAAEAAEHLPQTLDMAPNLI